MLSSRLKIFMRLLLLPILLFLLNFNLFSQQCGTDYYFEILVKDYLKDGETISEYLIRNNLFEFDEAQDEPRSGEKKSIRTIPVVVHVIHEYGEGNISKEQIENQLEILNADFQRKNTDTSKTRDIFKSRAASFDIEFRLARIAPDGSCTEGINRIHSDLTNNARDNVKNLSRWDYRRYLNIWIVNSIENFSEEGTVLGFAFFPFSPNATQLDGIVCRHDRFGNIGTARGTSGRTMTHEVGHWLGLFHTFNWGCSNNGDNVGDTPPAAGPNYGCPLGVNTCNVGNPNLPDMVENYMDYSNGSCMNMFTNGQRAVADNFLNNTNNRGRNIAASNLTATGVFTNPTCAPRADFYTNDPNSQTVCAGTSITFKDWSYNGPVTSYFWEFTNATPSTSTAQNPTVVFNQTGSQTVKLTVTGPGGSNVMTRQNFIVVTPSVGSINPPFLERFSTAASVNNWEVGSSGTNGWRFNASFGNNGNGCLLANINSSTPSNAIFDLVSEGINLSNVSEALLVFDLAYAKSTSSAVAELLLVEISTDCKKTFTNIAVFNEQTGLITHNVPQQNWAPTSASQWATKSINLEPYLGQSNVHIRLRAVSRSGNSIFVDNFRIENTLSTEKIIFNSTQFNIYPNPNSDKKLTIESNVLTSENINYAIKDVTGKVILSGIITNPKEIISIAALNQGVYFVSLNTSSSHQLYTQKLVILDN